MTVYSNSGESPIKESCGTPVESAGNSKPTKCMSLYTDTELTDRGDLSPRSIGWRGPVQKTKDNLRHRVSPCRRGHDRDSGELMEEAREMLQNYAQPKIPNAPQRVLPVTV